MSNTETARERLERFGNEALCEAVSNAQSLTSIANEVGVSIGSLLSWIDAVPERSARVREARIAMAKVWDERAEDEIRLAEDELSLKKAKEIAHHYRWRASKIAPKEYGDKVQQEVTGADGSPFVVKILSLSDQGKS
jgi:hypothetical protein